MPSIPQSLLWISLVVLWLFVLVPMLISKRDAVRRTSDVALATRVLNTGGRARLRRRGPAAGHYSDPDWRPNEDDDEYDDYDGDDAQTAPRKAIVLAAAESMVAESEYLDVDVVEMDSGALPVGATATPRQAQLPLDFDAERPETDLEAGPATQAIRTSADADFTEDTPVDDQIAEAEVEATVEAADELDGVDDGTAHDYETVDDSSGIEAPSESEAPLADSMIQARRQRYETTTSLAVRERKFLFRKRMLVALGVLIAVSAIAAAVLAPALWWVCGAVGVVAALYLGYLRRQTRIEAQLRKRRARRVARSRLGVENTNDRDYDVVPARLRRPGAVVLDIDDEDPIFEHLEYASLADSYDLPRASGQ